MDIERIRKEIKRDPHILDSLPLFYKIVVERLVDENFRDLDGGKRRV